MKDSTKRILEEEADKSYGASYCRKCGKRCITNKGIRCPVHGKLRTDQITSKKPTR